MKKVIVSFIFVIAAGIIVSEGIMRFRYGVPLHELDTSAFKFNYVDIHKKWFKKVPQGNNYRYIPQKPGGMKFSAVKAPDTIRIFIVGGSVAGLWGRFPFADFLNELIPNKNFEVINCGMGGYDSYRVYLVEKEILSYQPDLIIVLSGNNEYYDPVKLNLYVYYFNKFLRKLWIYRKLQNRFLEWRNKQGWLHFRNKERRLIDYEKNIQRIVRKTKGVPIILCTLPVNLKDSPPTAPCLLNKQFLEGRFFLNNEDYQNAIDAFRKFLETNPDNPLGWYFLGHVYEGIKNYTQAKESYLRALDSPESFWDRANPSSNEIIRQICTEEGVGLADLERTFMDIASHGLIGRKQLFDNCHWYYDYNLLVAKVIIKEMFQNSSVYSLIFGSRKNKLDLSCVFPFLKEFERKYDAENIICKVVYEIVTKPVYNFADITERTISDLETLYLTDPDLLEKIQFSKQRIEKDIIKDFFLERSISEFKTVYEKYWLQVFLYLGETCRRLKLYQKSLEYFSKAAVLDEDSYLPYLGRVLVYCALKDKEKAHEDIAKAEKLSDSLEVKYYKEILKL